MYPNEMNNKIIMSLLKTLDINPGEAFIVPYKEKYKLILRKEENNKFILVNPIDLEKYMFNIQGILLLLLYIYGTENTSIVAIMKDVKHNLDIDELWEFLGFLERKF